jgi:hypothetical protein
MFYNTGLRSDQAWPVVAEEAEPELRARLPFEEDQLDDPDWHR